MNQTVAPNIIPAPAMIEGWNAIEKPLRSDSDRRAVRLRRRGLLGRSGGAGVASGSEGRWEKASSDVAVLAGLRTKAGLSGGAGVSSGSERRGR